SHLSQQLRCFGSTLWKGWFISHNNNISLSQTDLYSIREYTPPYLDNIRNFAALVEKPEFNQSSKNTAVSSSVRCFDVRIPGKIKTKRINRNATPIKRINIFFADMDIF
ncbi:MAG: hypothetical protein ACI83D_000489, partial [Planctomycetota bacterium]